jgi:flagellar basal body-associated protein FliL
MYWRFWGVFYADINNDTRGVKRPISIIIIIIIVIIIIIIIIIIYFALFYRTSTCTTGTALKAVRV